MKKKYILLMLLFISITMCVFNSQKKEIITNKSKFNIYKEVDGEYQKQDTNVFPTTGYYLNTEESSCENGSEVSQNSDYSVNLSFNKSDKCNLYYDKMKLVTFDANGGSVNVESKYVKPGDNYGDLPTPERSGYTFLGWNGKNIFDIEYFMNVYSNFQTNPPAQVTFDNELVWRMYGGMNNDGLNYQFMKGEFKENTSYTFSFDFYQVKKLVNNIEYPGVIIYCYYTDETYSLIFNASISSKDMWDHNTFTSNTEKTIDYLRLTYGTGSAYTYFKNFQMEENEEETEYEPYLITDTTVVVQNKNHTLKAIWYPNGDMT